TAVNQDQGREGYDEHAIPAYGSGVNDARVTHQERHPDRFLVHQTLVKPAVVAQEKALVGSINHDRVLRQTLGIQIIEHSADVVVQALDAAQIVLDVILVTPLAESVSLKVRGDITLQVGLVHVLPDPHLHCRHAPRLSLI